MRETHLVSTGLEHLESVRVHIAPHRQVRGRWCQVLTDGQHIDLVVTHVLHHLQDFFVGLAQADHDAALGRHARVQGLEFFQQVQRELVVAAGARFFVQALRGFQVVVHHVGWRQGEDAERAVIAAAEVGHQHFNLRAWRQRANTRDAVDKMLRTAVAQVVPVHAGDHHVTELERGNRLGQVVRLVDVQRVGPAVADVAKRASARAFVAHDHESGCALAKAFADVRAAGFFAHRIELVLAQDLLDLVKARARTAGLDADPVGFLEYFGAFDLDRNARELGRRLLFGQRVVVLLALGFADDRVAGFGCAHGVSRLCSRARGVQRFRAPGSC